MTGGAALGLEGGDGEGWMSSYCLEWEERSSLSAEGGTCFVAVS